MIFLVGSVVVLGLASAWPARPRALRLARPGRSRPRRPVDPRLAYAMAALIAAVVLSPLLVPVLLGLGLAHPRWAGHRAAARERTAVADAVPETADLLGLAVGGGLSVPLALPMAARWSPKPLGAAFSSVDDEVSAGRPLVDALDDLAHRLGPPVRPLIDVLLMSERYGVPLADGLERVAREARLERRRRGEERARRVPVLLLFPLVLCILPAFALLTVVPLLVGSLPDLPPLSP